MKQLSGNRLAGIFICVFFFVASASVLFSIISLPLPVQSSYKIWIPEGARVLPRSMAHAGTFRLDAESMDAIKERCRKILDPSAIKVVYAEASENYMGQIMREPGVYYWVPDGYGAYDYAMDPVPPVSSWGAWLFFERNVTFNPVAGEFVFSFSRLSLFAISCGLVMALSALAGGLTFFVGYARSARP